MKRPALLIPLTLLLLTDIGCRMPSTTVQVVEGRGSLRILGAPAGSQLLLDGIPMGAAARFAGDPEVLLVEPGTRLVEIRQDGTLLHAQRIFVGGGELRTITLSAHAPAGPSKP